MKPNERDLMSNVFVKAIAPHRQKVLQGDKEMRLQQLANRMMADQMRQSGQSPTGDMFTQGRDKLMRDMVMNPEAHNIKFMGERVPFEGQTLGSSLSVPDVAGEQEAIDSQFSDDETLDFTNEMRDTRSAESYKTGDTTAREKFISEVFDDKGNLKPASQFMDREEDEKEDDSPQSEDDLMDRMARKAVNHISSFRNAWMVIKNDPYDMYGREYDTHCPRCGKGIYREDEDDLLFIREMGMCIDCAMK
jgi:hypothetical protein|tara:strand:- start:4319 stop:5062 length:744 start_codon:yes stop_codon:yes gene_type:complete